jgi:hypothetical protein
MTREMAMYAHAVNQRKVVEEAQSKGQPKP